MINTSFATLTKTAVDVAMTYSIDLGIVHQMFASAELDGCAAWVKADPDRLLVLSVRGIASDLARQWDNTRDDAKHLALAHDLKARGIAARTVIRYGWEMQGSWFPWGPTKTGDGTQAPGFVRMFRRVAKLYRAVPELRINWCANGCPQNAGAWWPGDDVVDIVGMDRYDAWVGNILDPAKRWARVGADFDRQAAFADAHGKAKSLDEWACWHTGSPAYGGGDSPYFVTSVAKHLADHGYLYSTYFDSSAGGVGVTLADCPKARAAYMAAFA
jgi:hypothetical protein